MTHRRARRRSATAVARVRRPEEVIAITTSPSVTRSGPSSFEASTTPVAALKMSGRRAHDARMLRGPPPARGARGSQARAMPVTTAIRWHDVPAGDVSVMRNWAHRSRQCRRRPCRLQVFGLLDRVVHIHGLRTRSSCPLLVLGGRQERFSMLSNADASTMPWRIRRSRAVSTVDRGGGDAHQLDGAVSCRRVDASGSRSQGGGPVSGGALRRWRLTRPCLGDRHRDAGASDGD